MIVVAYDATRAVQNNTFSVPMKCQILDCIIVQKCRGCFGGVTNDSKTHKDLKVLAM